MKSSLRLSLPAALFAASLLPFPALAASTAASAPAAPAPATAAAAGDIFDIRPPLHVPAPFPWLPWTAGAAGAAALSYGAWRFAHRARRKLPWELALEQLEAIRPLMAEETAQPFSLAVSEIVRRFVEQSFPVRAAHRTTEEFLHDLLSVPESPLADHRESLGGFLGHCDLAKFARWSLTAPQMEEMLASARAFVFAVGQPLPAPRKTLPRVPAPALAVAQP